MKIYFGRSQFQIKFIVLIAHSMVFFIIFVAISVSLCIYHRKELNGGEAMNHSVFIDCAVHHYGVLIPNQPTQSRKNSFECVGLSLIHILIPAKRSR